MSAAHKNEYPGGAGQIVKTITKRKVNFNPTSTSTEAQVQRLLDLITSAPRSTYELRQVGVSHTAARILDLEKRGYVFDSGRITTVDSDGYSHRGVALYILITTPEGGAK